MNKLNVVVTLMALALVAVAAVVRAEDQQQLVNELKEGDSDVNEGPESGIGEFFARKNKEPKKRDYLSPGAPEQHGTDILQHGIPDTVAGRHGECRSMTTVASCKVCCRERQLTADFRRTSIKNPKQLLRLKFRTCDCYSDTPQAIPLSPKE